MSPYNKKKLNKLRKSLDIIDKQLLNIFKRRTEIVKQVIKTKEFTKQLKNL